MDFRTLLSQVGHLPLFESALLLAGERSASDVRRQLSRWVGDGRVVQLRRGLYMLAAPYRKEEAHPFLIANRLVSPSYVSHLSALSFWNMIPEGVPVTTSVTTARPQNRSTREGRYLYRHVSAGRWFGFTEIEVQPGQIALVAKREKALLDLVYLTPGSEDDSYLRELRLQNMEEVNAGTLDIWARAMGGGKMERAAARIRALRDAERSEFGER